MIQASRVIEALGERAVSLCVGVPCSFLAPLIDGVIGSDAVRYIGATSEGEAAGIALGAWLAGEVPVTLCQNSGLGNMVNPLTSIVHPCRAPFLMLCTWRGRPGLADEPQHELMGRAMGPLLDAIEVEWAVLGRTEGDLEGALEVAWDAMARRSLPFCLVVEGGVIAPGRVAPPSVHFEHYADAFDLCKGDRFTRFQALERILETVGDETALVATTGKTGRELFTLADRPQHFYCVGAMGCASAIGLGLSLGTSRTVVVLDGDGAALMKLGNMTTIGVEAPQNLIHVVLDNGVHDSTGGQQTASSVARFADIARACGYRRTLSCDALEDLEWALNAAHDEEGPHLIHVPICPGSRDALGRPTVHPADVARRFRDFVGGVDSRPALTAGAAGLP
jgi:phosphonopyruvate decarboxylase